MTKYGLFFLVLLGFSESVQAKLFNAQEFMLPNGMQVAVIENHKAPLIKHMVWYRIGSVDEDFGKGGSAHLLEHLMFRGTSKVPDADFNHIMDNLGVVSNAFTNYDVTTYHQFADISKLEALMALEADRMQNLNFNDQAFAAEQKIVLQERKQVVENDPESAFDERLNLILWGNSPYSRPITGTEDEIMALSAADIYKFYYQYYAPNNAILVLSGDIDVKTAKKLAEKYYDISPYVYCADNPIKYIDPDGKSVWSKGLKGFVKVGRSVVKNGVSALNKADTYLDAFSDITEAINTIADSEASVGDKVVAGLSLASELLPVSVEDVKDAGKVVKTIGNKGRPGTIIAKENGITIKTYGTNDAHKPAHAHVTGKGSEVRVGPNGKPLKGQPELTTQKKRVVDNHKKALRKEVKAIGKENKKLEENGKNY